MNWTVQLTTRELPRDRHPLNAHAYFLTNAHYGNIHHFFVDTLEGLFQAVKKVGDFSGSQLTSKHEVHLLAQTHDYTTRMQHERLDEARRTVADSFLQPIGFAYYDTYVAPANNTCYKRALFPEILRVKNADDLEPMLKAKLGLPLVCNDTDTFTVVLQLRNYRSIVNGKEVSLRLQEIVGVQVRQVRCRMCALNCKVGITSYN